jgi:acetyl esterase/lipase
MPIVAIAFSMLLLTSCSGRAGSIPSTPTTLGESSSTVTSVVWSTENPVAVYAPDEPGPYPVVVTVHGGAWVGGDPADMAALADDLGRRAVVFNVTYRNMSQGGRFPDMVTDVACGVLAASRQAADYTTTPDQIYLIGHSAGAHLAALVALAPDVFSCDGEIPEVAGFVGLAGPYDVTRVAILNTFFGDTLEEAPEVWAEGNPLTYAISAPDVPILLIHGADDQVVPLSFGADLASELEDAGAEVDLVELAGATHQDVRDPLVVGDLIRDFISG